MRLHHLVRYLSTNVWAIEPSFLAAGQQLIREALRGRSFTGLELHAELGIPSPDEDRVATRAQAAGQARIAVVPIMGVIEDHASSLGTSARQIDAAFSQALASRKVDAILFDVDSPGGVVTLVPELADKIATARGRGTKPMLAFNGGLMASAAYWIGAAAGEIMVTPSGQAGSIGVFTWHEDWSRHLQNEGIDITEFSAGKFKTEGAPWKPLTEEAAADIQASVERAYGWFVKSVAANRRDTQTAVREGYGRGRMLGADQVLAANLADRIGTFEEAVERLAGQVQRQSGRRGTAQARELDLDVMARRP
jgi:signal peptide peptidase SppA